MTALTIRPTEYLVTGLPLDDEDAFIWCLRICWRGPGDKWAVLRHAYCLSKKGGWDIELQPSSRTDKWLATHRFDSLPDASAAAEAAYPTVIINGLWVRDGKLVKAS